MKTIFTIFTILMIATQAQAYEVYGVDTSYIPGNQPQYQSYGNIYGTQNMKAYNDTVYDNTQNLND